MSSRSYESLFLPYQYAFHVQKLILHRASMKRYYDYLTQHGITVSYVEEDQTHHLYHSGGEVVCYDVADEWLEQKMQRSLMSKMSRSVLEKHCRIGDEFMDRLESDLE